MARPPKPRPLKALAGTIQPCRDRVPDVEFQPLENVPPAPDWLPNSHALKEWNRLAPLLTRVRLLAEADLSSLAMLCALHGKIVQMYAAGTMPPASTITALRGLQSDFGLSAVARNKVTAAPQGKPKNKFAANGRRGTDGGDSKK